MEVIKREIQQILILTQKHSPSNNLRIQLEQLYTAIDKNPNQKITQINLQNLISSTTDTSSSKTHLQLLSLIQKLLSLNQLMDYQCIDTILLYVILIREIEKEPLQLKVFQVFAQLLNPEIIDFCHFSLVEKV